MTGFIKRLFGSKRDQPDPSNQSPNNLANQKKQAYFLDADAAKTYGDIDYMRTSKAVRRTFPKTKGNQGEFELTKSVSSMNEQKPESQPMNSSPPDPTSSAMPASQPSFKKDETEERRKTDTSMDMFRNMARDIRKP